MPARRAWEQWTRENTYQSLDVPGIGQVETWWDLTDVHGALVSYRQDGRDAHWNYSTVTSHWNKLVSRGIPLGAGEEQADHARSAVQADRGSATPQDRIR